MQMRPEVETPNQVMKYVELVLDPHDQLIEQKRLPGENNVRLCL